MEIKVWQLKLEHLKLGFFHGILTSNATTQTMNIHAW